MAKRMQNGKRKVIKTAVHKAAGRSASVMKLEYLAEIERFRLMDDDFMFMTSRSNARTTARSRSGRGTIPR